MFKLNLKIALRNLWRNKGFSLINIGGLAIGLASCMVLLIYVAYEWSYDKQFKNSNKTYVIYQNVVANGKTFSWPWTPNVMAGEVQEKLPGVKYASHSTYPRPNLITLGNNKQSSKVVFADPSFLKILDYKFIKGNPEKVLQNLNSIILTKSFAKKLFGNEDPINKTVKLENQDVLKVEAIIEDSPANSSIIFECIMPWDLFLKRETWARENNWGNNMCLTMVQLQDNKFFPAANAYIHDIYKRNQKENLAVALLHPLDRWHLYGDFVNGKSVGGKIDQLKIFLLLAFCILLIACVNFMNLSTARSERRAKEVGVRKAIGSSRQSLISQFFSESILITFIATVIAFILVEISIPYFNNLLNIKLEIDYSDFKFWAALFILMIFTGLTAGSYPALYLSSFEPIKVLKGLKLKTDSSVSVRKVLVVGQFVFAACLIVCTTIIYQQLNYIKNKPIGYDQSNLIQFPADSSSVMLNEAAVKMMGLKKPIGAVITFWGTKYTNVSVVKDFVVESAYQKVAPMIFRLNTSEDISVIIARLNPNQNMSSSLAEIDEVVKNIEPNYPVNRKFVNESFEVKFQDEKVLGSLSNWFGGFAVFISCLGLLGLALFMAEQRKKEISIRKVLGASTANILTLLNKDFIKLVAIANLIAFPLAYIIINKWLSAFEYRVSISSLPFVLAGCISVIIAVLTVSIQSVKVAKANPVDALKYE
ncbi:FtsX-like permease family protein [Pedobacter petrophilus]|uniref:FtsX-like permease family protein n=1 Tax=Pedobacter petrophilus TaxID=1908241 RepID=A0A7K0G4Z8_9SPHI|nr:FtsX-like permease family protein [Pedobacter petrophilus]MRX78434.1 FtsX-like permease family protein [Pedobacter petrophilus]